MSAPPQNSRFGKFPDPIDYIFQPDINPVTGEINPLTGEKGFQSLYKRWHAANQIRNPIFINPPKERQRNITNFSFNLDIPIDFQYPIGEQCIQYDEWYWKNNKKTGERTLLVSDNPLSLNEALKRFEALSNTNVYRFKPEDYPRTTEYSFLPIVETTIIRNDSKNVPVIWIQSDREYKDEESFAHVWMQVLRELDIQRDEYHHHGPSFLVIAIPMRYYHRAQRIFPNLWSMIRLGCYLGDKITPVK